MRLLVWHAAIWLGNRNGNKWNGKVSVEQMDPYAIAGQSEAEDAGKANQSASNANLDKQL